MSKNGNVNYGFNLFDRRLNENLIYKKKMEIECINGDSHKDKMCDYYGNKVTYRVTF